MIVESDNPHVAHGVRELARIIEANDGLVADDFIVREDSGFFDCAIAAQAGVPDRILVSYSTELTVPMGQIEWSDDADLLDPVGGLTELNTVQRSLLDQWLAIINSTDKIAGIRKSLPRFSVAHWGLRHHLADAGFPHLRTIDSANEAKEIMISWHCGGIGPSATNTVAGKTNQPDVGTERTDPRRNSRRFLIPLKHFLNHDPEGATQIPVPGRTAVATSASSSRAGTYENYGDLDALQLLVGFGYVDSRAPLVHSVPTEVDTDAWGKVVLEWRGTRNGDPVRDIPRVERTEEGLRIHHLTARPTNRARIVTLLSMVGQSGFGMTPNLSTNAAESLLDAIASANVRYYERLDQLVLEAQRAAHGLDAQPPGILADLAVVSLLQRERLTQMWGSTQIV